MGITRTCMTSDDVQGKKCPTCGKEMEGTGMMGIAGEFSVNGMWWSCPHCGHTENDGGIERDRVVPERTKGKGAMW